MTLQTDICIIGGGPGGLTCAQILAENGRQVTLVERKPEPGPKVCAGGITWHGFLQHVPAGLIQKSFTRQHIYTPWQHVQIHEKQPIVATVDREDLGRWMAEKATLAGATILSDTKALSIDGNQLKILTKNSTRTIQYTHLVGADGANSMVRRSLGLSAKAVGIGLNAFLPITRTAMEWHLRPQYFRHGYGWIFPHGKTISIGAYTERHTLPVSQLKQNLINWARERDILLPEKSIRAGLINFDYQGHAFGNRWLVGEAAGLASGLTGEGIYPAIVSARAVSYAILQPDYTPTELTNMIHCQKRHNAVLKFAGKYPRFGNILMNTLVLLLRLKILNFHMLEMA